VRKRVIQVVGRWGGKFGFNEPQRHRERRGGEEEIGREKEGLVFCLLSREGDGI
jgi:hypothetical protein